jgi:hypothetical protein
MYIVIAFEKVRLNKLTTGDCIKINTVITFRGKTYIGCFNTFKKSIYLIISTGAQLAPMNLMNLRAYPMMSSVTQAPSVDHYMHYALVRRSTSRSLTGTITTHSIFFETADQFVVRPFPKKVLPNVGDDIRIIILTTCFPCCMLLSSAGKNINLTSRDGISH